MKHKIYQVIYNPLISGSIIILAGSLLGNFFNFLFNIFMSKNLSPAEYGTLVSLVSLMTLATLPAGSIVPTVVKFAATYFAKNEFNLLRGLFYKIFKPSVIFALLALVIFTVFTRVIADFFKIKDTYLIYLVGIAVSFGFISVVNVSLLQAKLAFKFISITNLIGAVLKLSIGVLFVFLGFSVSGAMWAIILSFGVPYLLSFFQLKFIFEKHVIVPTIRFRELFSYGIPASLAQFFLTSFVSTDILLIKHFYDPKHAGLYAGLSLVGRVIFFLSAPIGTVMFPLVVQKFTRKERYHTDFIIALLLVLIPSVFLTGFYFFFPKFTVEFFLKGNDYLSIVPLVPIFGAYIGAYSLLALLTNFYLSINKTRVFIPIGAGAIIQAILIIFYHGNFAQVIIISFSIVSLLLVSLLLYYFFVLCEK